MKEHMEHQTKKEEKSETNKQTKTCHDSTYYDTG
jgi:hypothetical protein